MQTFDFPIEKNPVKTREDTVQSLFQILDPLVNCFVSGNTGIRIGSHGTVYSPRVIEMEGWSRMLWGLAPLAAGGGRWKFHTLHFDGLKHGADTDSPFYWGDVGDFDQRIVELAAIAVALLIAPQTYWQPLSDGEKKRLAEWMLRVNTCETVKNNWIFFRVLTNLAMERLGCSFSAEQTEKDLRFLESLYTADGWYKDGHQYDNYNPWALHFYALLYYKYKKDVDVERCKRIRERAVLFARQYKNFFHSDGSTVPYGRSLTYRFASSAFFAACAFADIEALPWGEMKGLVLRNLRWWFKKPVFNAAGLLTVGYAYENLYMSEQYNAPGSPYWALKAYLILALPDDHPFWAAQESDLHIEAQTELLPVPGMLFCRNKDDTVMLNAGQYPGFALNQAAAKYSKFAYSAQFGFSVAISGYGLEKTGCDSMLMLSKDGEYWRERRAVHDICCTPACLRSQWDPWPDVQVTTWLIPCKDAHIRIHRIQSACDLKSAEGGFAIPVFAESGDKIPVLCKTFDTMHKSGGIVIQLPWASAFIADMGAAENVCRTASDFYPEPNSSLMYNYTVLPLLTADIRAGQTLLACITGAFRSSVDVCLPRIEIDFDKRMCIIGGETVRLC